MCHGPVIHRGCICEICENINGNIHISIQSFALRMYAQFLKKLVFFSSHVIILIVAPLELIHGCGDIAVYGVDIIFLS